MKITQLKLTSLPGSSLIRFHSPSLQYLPILESVSRIELENHITQFSVRAVVQAEDVTEFVHGLFENSELEQVFVLGNL